MYITEISIDGFKNLKNISLKPSENINVIYGENAQGKTNFIEALWILSGVRSFRGTKEKNMVAFDGDFANVNVTLKNSVRDAEISVTLSKKPGERRIKLNGVPQRYLSSLFGTLKCVVFTPEDLDISKGSPDVRRAFIDLCISQIKPQYLKTSAKYVKVLEQRNALLKNIQIGASKPDDLDVWDEQASRLGAYISVLRNQYTKKLMSFCRPLYSEISNGSENLTLKYVSNIFENPESLDDLEELSKKYLEALRSSRQEDIRFGTTSYGIQRDDVLVNIDSRSAKEFGSQGQNRSAALCMKLGQAYILYEELKDMPIILLDDVLSELDGKRREFIISKLRDMQIFITSCERVNKLNGRVYKMEKGKISARQ